MAGKNHSANRSVFSCKRNSRRTRPNIWMETNREQNFLSSDPRVLSRDVAARQAPKFWQIECTNMVCEFTVRRYPCCIQRQTGPASLEGKPLFLIATFRRSGGHSLKQSLTSRIRSIKCFSFEFCRRKYYASREYSVHTRPGAHMTSASSKLCATVCAALS